MIPSVAGCTTGSLNPRCPYIRDEVLSLYQAEFLFAGYVNGGGLKVPYAKALCTLKHET